MKNFLKHLLSGLCLILASISAFGTPNTIDISLDPTLGKEQDERPSKGNRLPASPVICTIDFDNHRIATSIPDEIIAYELWDEDGETTFVSYATDYEFVTDMIDKNKPLIIYAVPSYHINNSHSWIIDGYKIKERTITTTTVKNDVIVSSTTSTETCNMVHCDYGFGGYANGYYISGIFKLNDTNSEKDFIDDSSNDKTHYNNYIHLITYDLP